MSLISACRLEYWPKINKVCMHVYSERQSSFLILDLLKSSRLNNSIERSNSSDAQQSALASPVVKLGHLNYLQKIVLFIVYHCSCSSSSTGCEVLFFAFPTSVNIYNVPKAQRISLYALQSLNIFFRLQNDLNFLA